MIDAIWCVMMYYFDQIKSQKYYYLLYRHDISPVFTGIPVFLSWPRSFLWKSQNRFKNLGDFYGGGGYICWVI